MEKAAERYFRHHRAIQSSPKTIQYHRDTLKSLFAFLRAKGHSLALDDFGADDVLNWMDNQQERGLAQKTVWTRVVSVKAWTRWLVAEEWLARDPLKKLKPPKVDDKPKETLAPAQVDALLKACNPKTYAGCRDRAILLLLFSTGLRLAEIVALHMEDIDYGRGLILVRRGKGGKFRVVPLGTTVERALDKYLSHPKRGEGHGALFLAGGGQALSYRGFRAIFYRLEARTGVRCNPHKWRHSSAVQYLRAGGRVETLKAMLGHSTLDMTLHYARVAGVDLVAAHEVCDPARSLKVRL